MLRKWHHVEHAGVWAGDQERWRCPAGWKKPGEKEHIEKRSLEKEGRKGKATWSRSSHFDSFGNLVKEFLHCPEATQVQGKFRYKADRWAKCYSRGSHSAEVLYMCWKRERQDTEAPLKAEMETQLQHIKASDHSGNKGKRWLWRKWQRPWFPIVCSQLTRSQESSARAQPHFLPSLEITL